MIEYRPLKAEHLIAMRAQSAQTRDLSFLVGFAEPARLEDGMTFSGWVDNACVAAGGVLPRWPGHGDVWCVLAPDARFELLSLTNFGRELFDAQPYRRLTATVLCDFLPGHRWLEMLGFTREIARMRAFDPDGRDHAQYVRIRE